MTSYISINGHTIRSNTKHGTEAPPIRIARAKSGTTDYASSISIVDEFGNELATLEYSPHKPIMKCGARLVLKTEHTVRINS